MTSPETCANCGEALAAANSYLSERGAVCWRCFGQLQSAQDLTQRQNEALEARLTQRARQLAAVHGLVWGTTVILSARPAQLPDWLSSLLLLATLALVVALVGRSRPGYWAALVVDGAGALAALAWAALGPSGSRAAALLALLPLVLLALTVTLRSAFRPENAQLEKRSLPLGRRLVAAAVVLAAAGGLGLHLLRSRARPDPALDLLRTKLPAWQVARGRGSTPGDAEAQALFAQARAWPALAGAFETLDNAWPNPAGVNDAINAVNLAMQSAGLPYFINSYPVGERPFVLTYRLDQRIPWRIGERTVDVLRLERLDTLNIELGLFGSTDQGRPVVMLDRVEAMLAKELPAMYGHSAEPRSNRNDFDRAANERLRTALEARLGSNLAVTAAALGERDRLLEQMRSRLRGGSVELAAPDGFVLGDAWLEGIEPEAELTRPGGPLILDSDLKDVARADRKLRDPATTQLLRSAVDIMALTTEAHEARHALDETDPIGPPPPALFEAMPQSTTAMIGFADKELRAILGELHDTALPVCPTLAMAMRNAYSRWARRNPHYFATLVILRKLDPDSDLEPAEQLAMLCAVPDGDLRARVAAAWQSLYGSPMPRAERLAR